LSLERCRSPFLFDRVKKLRAPAAKAAKVKNLYAELGSLAMMRSDPARYAVLIGTLLDGFGADHILWGTDTPVIGPPHWQIEAFQRHCQVNLSRIERQPRKKLEGVIQT